MTRSVATCLAAGTLFCLAFSTTAQASHPQYCVVYQQPHWQSRLIDGLIPAELFMARLRAQGWNDVRWHPVDGRFCVYYRMTGWWTYRTVTCHLQAHQLADWVRSQGYEARVVHH